MQYGTIIHNRETHQVEHTWALSPYGNGDLNCKSTVIITLDAIAFVVVTWKDRIDFENQLCVEWLLYNRKNCRRSSSDVINL